MDGLVTFLYAFKQNKLPNWLRDFLAILKVTGAILLLVGIIPRSRS